MFVLLIVIVPIVFICETDVSLIPAIPTSCLRLSNELFSVTDFDCVSEKLLSVRKLLRLNLYTQGVIYNVSAICRCCRLKLCIFYCLLF